MRKPPIKVVNYNGQVVRLLRPDEKGGKFATELKNNQRYTNMCEPKFDRYGKPLKLSKTQKAFRSGYLTARSDNAKCYKAIQNKGYKPFWRTK